MRINPRRIVQSLLTLGHFIPPHPSTHLDDWEAIRRVDQLDEGGDAVVGPHLVLGHLGVLVARGEVPQGADRGLRHVLLLPGTQDGVDERLHAVVLGDQRFVVGVVACEVGQDARGTGEHVEFV